MLRNPHRLPRASCANLLLPSVPVSKLTPGSEQNLCGETGIRTPETLLEFTRFPGVPLQPLEHLSFRVRQITLSDVAMQHKARDCLRSPKNHHCVGCFFGIIKVILQRSKLRFSQNRLQRYKKDLIFQNILQKKIAICAFFLQIVVICAKKCTKWHLFLLIFCWKSEQAPAVGGCHLDHLLGCAMVYFSQSHHYVLHQ